MNRQVALDVLGDLSTGPSLGTPSAPRARYANAKDVEDKLRILSGLIARDREDPSIDMALGKALGARSGDRWTVPEHDDMGEVRAIYKYVRDNVRYTGDAHKLDTFRRPARTLQLRIGDCDDAAALVGAMASAAGFEQGLRVVRTGDSDDFNHVYNVVGLPRTAPPLGECVAGGRAWWKKNALWECDHILPVAEGGGFCTIDNLRTLCVECHKAKTAELHARLAANRKARARRIAAPRSE